MMAFITMTISFTLAILLASAIGFMVMTNSKVMKWYVNYFTKSMSKFDDLLEEEMTKEL